MHHYFIHNGQNKILNDFDTHFGNFITRQIRESKRHNYELKFNAARNVIRQTWGSIRNITQKIVK